MYRTPGSAAVDSASSNRKPSREIAAKSSCAAARARSSSVASPARKTASRTNRQLKPSCARSKSSPVAFSSVISSVTGGGFTACAARTVAKDVGRSTASQPGSLPALRTRSVTSLIKLLTRSRRSSPRGNGDANTSLSRISAANRQSPAPKTRRPSAMIVSRTDRLGADCVGASSGSDDARR